MAGRGGLRRCQQLPARSAFADKIGLTEARFNTVVGLLVLAIVVLSPDGLMGLILRARDRSRGTPPSAPADRARRQSPIDGAVLANSS